jgi:two-component system invasion response regulator UvrY
MIRVMIADDHAILRRGLVQILSEHRDITVVAEAADAAEVLRRLREQPCDVLVLDIDMPGRSGLDVLRDVRYHYRKLPVLILTVYPDEHYGVRVLMAGAAGFLNKECAPTELVDAIRTVHTGRRYVRPAVGAQLAAAMVGEGDRPTHERLSDREFEVLVLIGSGKTVGEISELLVLSVKTVSTYRTRVLEKLGLRNNAELMRYVVNHGLDSPRSRGPEEPNDGSGTSRSE